MRWRGRFLVALALLTICGCVGPTMPQRQTKSSRTGRVLPSVDPAGQIAIVYSYLSQIRLGGLENLHPGDAHRQGRIFEALVRAEVISPQDVFVPAAASDEQLLAVHDEAYLKSLRKPANVANVIEFEGIALLPDSIVKSGIVDANRVATGGTLMAAELAMQHGLAINLGGGFHHAFHDHGEGFCMFADVPLAIHMLRERKLARRAMIVDTDIHQENGFASYYVRDKDVAILDIYEDDNYPAVKVPESHALPIPLGISEADYLALLKRELPKALDEFKPDVLFYVAGVDPLEGDRLGHAKVSADGLVQRDLFVLRESRRRGIPTVMTLAGGYHREGWRVTFRSLHVVLTGRAPQAAMPGSDE